MPVLDWNTLVFRVKHYYQKMQTEELITLYENITETIYKGDNNKLAVLKQIVTYCFPTVQVINSDAATDVLVKVANAFYKSPKMLMFPCPKGCGNTLGFTAKGDIVTVKAEGVTMFNDGAQLIVTCPKHGTLYTLR